MVTFAHTAPDSAEIMWNEQNWTLVSMPITSTRSDWDEGLRTVRQFNDLLRVLPPGHKAITQAATTRTGAPGRPVAPAGELPPSRAETARRPEPGSAAPGPVPPRVDPGRVDPARREPPRSDPARRPQQSRASRPGPASFQP
jgi:hypothetical protein